MLISREAVNQMQELTEHKSDRSEFIPISQIYTPLGRFVFDFNLESMDATKDMRSR